MPELVPFNALIPAASIEKDTAGFSEYKNGLLVDSKPYLYLYVQDFVIPGTSVRTSRKGILGLVPAHDASKILGHENVISENVQELIEVIDRTRISLPPVHTFHTQENPFLRGLSSEDLEAVCNFTDESDVQNSLFRIINSAKTLEIRKFYTDKKIYIADGHHRFCAHNTLFNKEQNQKGYFFVYLSDISVHPEQIFPIHRLLRLINIEKKEFLAKLNKFFTVTPVKLPDIQSEIEGKKYYYGLYTGNNSYIIKLKPGLEKEIRWKFPDSVKKLDLTVLHYYAIQEAAGIKGSKQKDSKEIKFSSIFTDCVRMVNNDELDVVFFCNPVNIQDIIEVADSGNVLPQKSTSFYPKVDSGLVFATV